MTRNNTIKTLSLATGAALALGVIGNSAMAAEINPFGMTELTQGYTLAAATEGKCGEAKCGGNKAAESKCGGDKAKEAKCGEGKCGSNKSKASEGKCGGSKNKEAEAKCGGNKAAESKCGGAK
ncbi:MAG: hypothetical protein OEY87_03290 [Gammaproteobacteria bacterium]|nr:hypothetical protein [Gammaproteobacteria bacterium]